MICLRFHFNKRAKIPMRFGLAQALANIVDGITGLLALPFGRQGTSFSYEASVATLQYGVNLRKQERKTKDLTNTTK